MQPFLAPNLIEPVVIAAREWGVGPRRVTANILPGDELHKHILAVGERRLVMRKQLPEVLSLLLRDKGIVSQVGQLPVRTLTYYANGARVLGILPPLGPALG